jgi:uncharacterized protein (TIGR02246 family)
MIRSLPIIALGLVALVGCAPPPPAEPPAPVGLSAADRAAIEAASLSWADAANAGDCDMLAAGYAEDAILLPPNQPAVEGRDAIREWCTVTPKMTDNVLEVFEIDGIGDLAYVVGRYETVVHIDGLDPIPDSGKYMEIRRRSADGTWELSRDMFNSDLAMP